METDLKFGLKKIRENLIQLQDHFIDYPCPQCIRKHSVGIEAYTNEILPMTKDEKLRSFLIKLRDFALNMRRKLGDVL